MPRGIILTPDRKFIAYYLDAAGNKDILENAKDLRLPVVVELYHSVDHETICVNHYEIEGRIKNHSMHYVPVQALELMIEVAKGKEKI